MGFHIEVPRKRERNTLHIAQERGEMLKPQRMTAKKFKPPRNPNAWKNEDWGEDDDNSGSTESTESVA